MRPAPVRLLILIALCTLAGNPPLLGSVHPDRSPETTVPFARRILAGFNMRVWLSNKMTMGLTALGVGPGTDLPYYTSLGLEYPRGSRVEHLYGAGPWFGARRNGVPHVDEGYNGNDARNEFIPEFSRVRREHFWHTAIGAAEYATAPDSIGYSGYYYLKHIIVDRLGVDNDGDGKINEDDLDGKDNDGDWNPLTDDVGSDGLPDSLETSCDGIGYDPVNNPDPAQDNFNPKIRDHCRGSDPNGNSYLMNDKDYYTERNGVPDHGEPHVDEDYGAYSEQDLYCSATDTFRTPVLFGHTPMGIKVLQRSHAWDSPSADAIIMMNYEFTQARNDTLTDVFPGMFVDPDLGPVSSPNYIIHNYSAYDPETRTAYVHNPVDTGSTPLGFTLLGASRSLDSLISVFQWFDLSAMPGPGTDDSAIYAWMGGGIHPWIRPNQDSLEPSDTRFLLSIGRRPDDPTPGMFGTFVPGDTLRMSIALVSGMDIRDMLNNARRAHEIYDHAGFVMPTVVVSDSFGTQLLRVTWSGAVSPYGPVTSYVVRYGPQPGQYTDSLTTQQPVFSVRRPAVGHKLFFSVRAMDQTGRPSAWSDEASNILKTPHGLKVTGGQRGITIGWDTIPDPEVAGYRLYRHPDNDPTLTIVNPVLLKSTSYYDTDVSGEHLYWYGLTVVDRDGFESSMTAADSGHLIRPAVPANFVAGRGSNYYYLSWDPNNERDFAGYNIYRKIAGEAGWQKMNPELATATGYLDTSRSAVTAGAEYYIEAVDSTRASNATRPESMALPMHNNGILVGLFSRFYPDSNVVIWDTLLRSYKHKFDNRNYFPYPAQADYLGMFSTVILVVDKNWGSSYYTGYPAGLKKYVLSGGHLLIIGRKFPTISFPLLYDFLSEIYGISPMSRVNSMSDFSGALGQNGFPSVAMDPSVLHAPDAGLDSIEIFPGIPDDRVVSTYRAASSNPVFQGMPVGIAAKPFGVPLIDAGWKGYYFSFPMSGILPADRKALLAKILQEFGEPPVGPVPGGDAPRQFNLADAYPNPCNPVTTIRFSSPGSARVTLTVYDVLGSVVARLIDQEMNAGTYSVAWDGSGSASGVYFYRLTIRTNGDARGQLFSSTKKILLTR